MQLNEFFSNQNCGFFFLNERNCKWCFDKIVFFLSELAVNRILIVSIVINKICSIIKKKRTFQLTGLAKAFH